MKRIWSILLIDGAVGGSQEWFTNVVMYIGGCAAATACDCCIYLALQQRDGASVSVNVMIFTGRLR